jgi:hypothetical protein
VVLLLAAGGQGAHPNGPAVRVDADHLGARAHVEVQGGTQAVRGLQQQPVTLLDDLADVVRQPAVREGDEVVPFEHHDLSRLVQATRPGGRRHPRGDAAHDHDLHTPPFPTPLLTVALSSRATIGSWDPNRCRRSATRLTAVARLRGAAA